MKAEDEAYQKIYQEEGRRSYCQKWGTEAKESVTANFVKLAIAS